MKEATFRSRLAELRLKATQLSGLVKLGRKASAGHLMSALVWSAIAISAALAANVHELVPPGLADGPGVWANIWNYPTGDIDGYCALLRSHGIRNVFLQTSRSNMPAIAHPTELAQVIEACHRHKIRVIGWAYLELQNTDADADKMIAAAKFQSPRGERLDAIAPDLEKNLTESKITKFSQRLREQLGSNYPMIAVVYSPLNHYQEVAHTPWKVLANYYDVIAPMSYWNSRYQKLDAYDYTVATVRTIRQMTGRPDIEVHVIGDGMGSGSGAIHSFLRACKKAEATSASIYPNQKLTPEQLTTLSRYDDYFQANSRFRLAAFREMLRSGVLQVPAGTDPSEPICRADFYHMLSRRLHVATPPEAMESRAPIYSSEAFATLAQIVETQQSLHGKKRRADRWFAAPAMAEAQQPKTHDDKPLNYLDASQIVIEAGSAIR
jgi:hypothetical protein